MSRLNKLFQDKKKNILSVYFTAGHPTLESTSIIIRELEKSGADFIEIGMPFSDPLADGPVIQDSSQIALKNGMTIKLLFEQLKDIRKEVNIPLILMGYLNPVMQYGFEKFCKKAKEVGVDGLILPDLPLFEYENEYKEIMQTNNLHNIFLITPQTSEARIKQIDGISTSFIYMVSTSSTTGAQTNFENTTEEYFNRIKKMQLKNPQIIGFGISNKETFNQACKYASGAIIGSAFVKTLDSSKNIKIDIQEFTSKIKATR